MYENRCCTSQIKLFVNPDVLCSCILCWRNEAKGGCTHSPYGSDLIHQTLLLVLLVTLRHHLCAGSRRKSLLLDYDGRLAASLLSNWEWTMVIIHLSMSKTLKWSGGGAEEVIQFIECLASWYAWEPGLNSQTLIRPSVVVHNCNPNTWGWKQKDSFFVFLRQIFCILRYTVMKYSRLSWNSQCSLSWSWIWDNVPWVKAITSSTCVHCWGR